MYTQDGYNMNKIIGFADNDTKKIFNQEYVKGISKSVQELCLRKLIMLNASGSIQDLRVPPGNRLEKLSGDKEGVWSIRINDQYRITFVVDNGFYDKVKLEDYHK